MNCQKTSIFVLCLLIGRTFSAPQPPVAPGAGGILPIALPIHALRTFNIEFATT